MTDDGPAAPPFQLAAVSAHTLILAACHALQALLDTTDRGPAPQGRYLRVVGAEPVVRAQLALLRGIADRHQWGPDQPVSWDAADYFTACQRCWFEPADPDRDLCPDMTDAAAAARAIVAALEEQA